MVVLRRAAMAAGAGAAHGLAVDPDHPDDLRSWWSASTITHPGHGLEPPHRARSGSCAGSALTAAWTE